jgi:two-component SAPR family response regulator
MVKKSRREQLANWITENEQDLHQYIFDHRNDPYTVGKVLRRIRKDGTPHQYVSAFNYAKEVKEW